MKRNKRDIHRYEKEERRGVGVGGLPQEVQLTLLFSFSALGLTREGQGRGSIQLSGASPGLPEAPRSPVSTARAHLP